MTRPTKERLAWLRGFDKHDELFDEIDALTAERDEAQDRVSRMTSEGLRGLVENLKLTQERDEARNAVKRLRFACWESEAEFDDALGETDVLIASWDAEEGGGA